MMKRLVSVFFILLVLVGAIVAYVQLGPIRTVLGIQQSFRSGDMDSLDESIDFEAVRASLKLQMRYHLNEQKLIETENPLLQTLYTSVSYSLIDGMVDEYLKPEMIQSLFDFSEPAVGEVAGNVPLGDSFVDEKEGKGWLAVAREYQALCDFDYTSWSEFEVSLKETIREPVSLALLAGTRVRFQRNGIYWKVIDIIFPKSFFKSKF